MIKVTVAFSLFEQGWTETYYRDGVDVTAAETEILRLVGGRLGIMGQGVAVDMIRGQNDATPPFVRAFRYKPSLAKAESVTDDPSFAWNGVTVNFTNGSGRQTPRIFRGIPHRWILNKPQRGTADIVQGLRQIEGFADNLASRGWGDRILNRTLGNPLRNVLTLVTAADRTDVTPNGSLSVTVGDTVVFYGTGCQPCFPREAAVIATGPGNTFAIPRLTGENRTDFPKKMKVRKGVYSFSAWTDSAVVAVSKRDTGRPLGVSRGRSRSKCRTRCC